MFDQLANELNANNNANQKPPPSKPTTIKRIPDGHGCTMVEIKYPTGEVRSRIQYDRSLMLALSHSPFSIAMPEEYFDIAEDTDEILPMYPKRYLPFEFEEKIKAQNQNEAKSTPV